MFYPGLFLFGSSTQGTYVPTIDDCTKDGGEEFFNWDAMGSNYKSSTIL